MKNGIKLLALIMFSFIAAIAAGPVIAEAFQLDVQTTVTMVGLVVFISGFIPKGIRTGAFFAEAPDVSAITTDFVRFGGDILKKAVNTLSIKTNPFYKFYPGVTAPLVLPRISAAGEPIPYDADDATSGNDIDFTDRVLTTRASKWDIDFDYEKFHNTYLASMDEQPYREAMLGQMAEEYWAQLNDNVVWLGNYDAAGTDVEDIADGWGTIIADEITAVHITPVATGAVSSSNAVAKHEAMLATLPAWARESGKVECIMSYTQFDNYKTNYRATYSYQFNPRQDGFYYLDGTNIKIRPESFMGTSGRLVYTMAGNLVWGVKGDNIKVYATARRNIIEVRPIIHIGFQIGDLGKIFVNDQA